MSAKTPGGYLGTVRGDCRGYSLSSLKGWGNETGISRPHQRRDFLFE